MLPRFGGAGGGFGGAGDRPGRSGASVRDPGAVVPYFLGEQGEQGEQGEPGAAGVAEVSRRRTRSLPQRQVLCLGESEQSAATWRGSRYLAVPLELEQIPPLLVRST